MDALGRVGTSGGRPALGAEPTGRSGVHSPTPAAMPARTHRSAAASRGLATQWRLTWHARQTAARRKVSLAEVLAVIDQPEVSYAQPQRGASIRICQRGSLAVVINVVERSVITVLLRSQSRWTDEDVRRRPRLVPA